jgi:signal transduction histidine kinase
VAPVRVNLSISRRLIFWITLLVCILVGAVLVVIGTQEVGTLKQQARRQALLIAQNMRQMNLQLLGRYDRAAVQATVDSQVTDQVPYIVFYDRSGVPFVANKAVGSRADIVGKSHFEEGVQRDAQFVDDTRRVLLQGRSLRVVEVEIPIFLPGSETKWASVKIGCSLEPMYADIGNVRAVLLLIGFGGLLLGAAGAAFLANRITRPLRKLVEGTVRISKGDFSRAIDIPPGDEIGDLAGSFNEMSGRLLEARGRMAEANRRLIQAEKLASIGRLAATIAHEIRNPLTSVKLNVQKVAEDTGLDGVEREHIALSMEGIGQIERFIKELLNYTRVAELALDRFALEQVLEESLKMLRESLDRRGIRLEKDYALGLPPVLVDGDKMRQVFLNILRNAEEALDAGGRIRVAMDMAEDGGRRSVRVRISDDGPGIRAKDRDNIFEPFFTTKPAGFGLGLANARKIVEQHGGTIQLVPGDGPGTSFIILIPCEEGT